MIFSVRGKKQITISFSGILKCLSTEMAQEEGGGHEALLIQFKSCANYIAFSWSCSASLKAGEGEQTACVVGDCLAKCGMMSHWFVVSFDAISVLTNFDPRILGCTF